MYPRLLLSLALTSAWGFEEPFLWQERVFFDALLTARDRLARQQSDPQLLAVMKSIATQLAQQVANLKQIEEYMKAQQDNLRYAFDQPDPESSLATIQANLETLSKGSEQIRNNLYYLTARCRIATSQTLPDPEMYQGGLLILGQIQQLQLELNTLYLDTVAARDLVLANSWATDKFFNHKMTALMRNVVRIQDSIFTVYNSAYELCMRSK